MHTQGYLTTWEAAAAGFVCAQTIHDWITDGRLRAVQYAGRWWVSKQSLEQVTAPLREPP